MRIVVLAAVAAMLAACGPSKQEKAERNAAIANFVPPFVLSRLDFGGVVERRFRRLDRNGDDKLEGSEIPQRMAGRVAEFDKDGDGTISSEEWSAGQLARFDRQDINHDGTVTADERNVARAKREDDLPTPAEEPANTAAPAG